ncbi:MAG: V-type ATP synthase subunit D [bacterium]|nr:V-type ATP synthase subunit D [bacterium]
MALALNKTSLKLRRDQLAMYRRYLPSLDLKRQQLIADLQRSRGQLQATQEQIAEVYQSQSGLFALLGASQQDLGGLVSVKHVSIIEENVLGVRLPVLKELELERHDYSMLAKPFWVDFLVEALEALAELQIRRRVEQTRVDKLAEAVRRITQRVNLFDKVLIPQARDDIQRIKIHLADSERAAVVRSKIAKAKQQRGISRAEDH